MLQGFAGLPATSIKASPTNCFRKETGPFEEERLALILHHARIKRPRLE
jgi:hypothetical protein